MTTISAKTVLRSRNTSKPDTVLSTLLLRYPRWVHAEVLTHRAFSRNAASSRAIPVEKQIEGIMLDPAMPVVWTKNEPGMQGYTLMNEEETNAAKLWWLQNMHSDISDARELHRLGAHKQIVNRLLEAHMHITVLVSSTEWENFLELRDHHAAEPHFQLLAKEIRKCLENDPVEDRRPGEWHLPFVSDEDWDVACDFVRHCNYVYPNNDEPRTADEIAIEQLQRLSVARCASTSYKTVDGFEMTADKANQIYDKLVTSKPVHASPLEHVAQVDEYIGRPDRWWRLPEQHGNFKGFRQLRFQL